MVVVEREGGGSATTVLVAVIIIVIIGLAFWFGFHGKGIRTGSTTNVNVTTPVGGASGGTGSTGY